MNSDCERVRMALMVELDGEGAGPDRAHLSTCESCRRWLLELRSVSSRLQSLEYQRAPVDLWPAVEEQIGQAPGAIGLPRGFWPIAGGVLVWRAVQLFVDLPMPALHPLVPLAATVAAVWIVAVDPLQIETSAPELRKRGA